MADPAEKEEKPAERAPESRRPAAPAPTPAVPGSRRAAAREFIASSRGAERAVDLLLRQNQRLRSEAASQSAVPDGGVVLSKADAEQWTAYQAFGKPADLTTRLTQADADKTFRAEREAGDHVAAMADAAGYKPKVLAKLARDLPTGAKLELREVEVDGTGEQAGQKVKRQVAHVVTGTGEAAKAEALDVYAAREWADFLPSLQGDDETTQDAGASQRHPQGRQSGATTMSPAHPAQREHGRPATPADPLVATPPRRYTSPAKWRDAGTAKAA